MRCTQRAREFAWTGHTQPAEFPLPTLKSHSWLRQRMVEASRKRSFARDFRTR